MKAFKGFNKHMTYRNFKYEIGNIYDNPELLEVKE